MKRRSISRSAVVVAIAVSILCASVLPAQAADGLFLAPTSVIAHIPDAVVVHDYGASSMVRILDPHDLPESISSRLHALPDSDRTWFRSWTADLTVRRDTAPHGGGPALVALAGPVDQRWIRQLESTGLTILAGAYPFAVVASGTSAAFARAAEVRTSAGQSVVRAIVPLSIEARMHRDLYAAVSSKAGNKPITLRLTTVSRDGGDPSISTRMLPPASLPALLADDPSIIYVEPAFFIDLHNNLAARSPLMSVQPVWESLGYNGTGMVISHNDTGVDLQHPDLPEGSVAATLGKMSYTDNSHGSHTAGSVAGRGSAASPLNTWECGDQMQPTATVRGMAWGARLVVNNILDGGLAEVEQMMEWGSRHGAHLSTNSWGLSGQIGPATAYGAASVAADRAVRDADPRTAGSQALAIFFSAGNLGPAQSTVTSPGNAKNVITVGATHNDRCGSWIPSEEPGPQVQTVLSLSSRGPSQGRIKPDLVAPGSDVLSMQSNDYEAINSWDQEWTGALYALNSGTSMSCALAAGAGAVLSEASWRTTGLRPSPALVKAALINGAVDLGLPRTEQGWGRVNLERSISGPPGGRLTSVDQAEASELASGEIWRHDVQVFSSTAPLKLTLVWTDAPGEEDAEHPLRNDLDLVVSAPDGTVYRGNSFTERWSTPNPGAVGDRDNTVENVFIETPPEGEWQVEVVAVNVAEPQPGLSGQDFALVYSGDAADCMAPTPPAAAAALAVADNLIEVSWSEVAGAEAYAVYRATMPGGSPYEPLATVQAPADHWQDSSAHGGITYYYVVRALAECWSEYSAEASATATGSCSLAPDFSGLQSLLDIEQVACGLELAWDSAWLPCGGEAVYDVFRSDSTDFEPESGTRIATGVTGNGYVDTGLPHGLRATYLVRAVDPGSGVSDSNRAHLSGTPTGPDWVWFSDDAESDSEQWRVSRGSPADADTDHWRISTSDAHSPTRSWFCSDDQVVKDQVLTMAAPLAISTQFNTELEFLHRFDFARKRNGARLEYSTDGGREWHDILDGDGFTVAADADRFMIGPYNETLSTAGGNPMAGADAWSGNSRGWQRALVDLSDFAGHALLLRWRVGCDLGNGVDGGWWVDDIRIFHGTRCQSCSPPHPPTGVLATARAGEVVLDWDETADATEYQVYRATRSGGPYSVIGFTDATSTDHVDDTVSGGTPYVYAIKVRTDCVSDFSEEVAVPAEGPCTLPPAFWGLRKVVNTGKTRCTLKLSWEPATTSCAGSGSGYRIYRSPSSDFEPGPSTLHASLNHSAEFWDQDLGDGEVYHYMVRAFDLDNGNEDDNLKALHGAPSGPPHMLFEDEMFDDPGAWRPSTGSPADSGTAPWIRADDPGPHWFCANEPVVKDQVIELTETISLPETFAAVLEFRHRFDLERLWDGGRMEYSTDGGATWQDILEGDGRTVSANPDRFLEGGYPAALQIGDGSNPLAGERAWTGASGGWTSSRVDLADLAGTHVNLRWRLGCDRSRAAIGWWLDAVRVYWITVCETRSAEAPRQGQGRMN